jgi:hypothetical protein
MNRKLWLILPLVCLMILYLGLRIGGFRSGATIPGDIRINGTINFAADAGSNDTYAITISGITTYTTGMLIIFTANTANTGACTININGLGAKSLKVTHDGDPGNNFIESGSVVVAVYDGTNFQVIQPNANP